MSCPTGLLYSGKIGEGGVCDWAATVVCAADEDEEEIVASSSPSAAGSDAVEAPAVSMTTSTAIATTATVVAAATTQPPPLITNPSNFYCGTSVEDASNSCVPCPGGTFEECNNDGSFSKGCFKGIDAQCNDGGTAGTTSTATVGTTTTASTTTDDDDAAGNNDGMTNDDESSSSSLQPSLQQTLPPRPTLNPTLPPWTNAPFVPSPSSSSSNQKTIIGYYASWQWYDRNKFADPNNIDFSKYTRIHYAFFQPDEKGSLYGTDEWGDPQILWGPYVTGGNARTRRRKMSDGGGSREDNNYKCSWDGPDVKNCNYHDLNRGLLHLAQSAGVQVMPSIGGWTLSDNFPAIAADEELREYFAKQCVELIEAYGFDGIDIDWEYPGYKDHSGTPEDTVNFTLLLKAVRTHLDRLGSATNRHFPLTAALPCGPDKIADIQLDQIGAYLDEFNLMSYDMHGAWDALTGTNAPLFDQGWTDKEPRWSAHGCVDTYVEAGIPLSRLNLGLPFYGRSFQIATGMKQFHDGADDINFHLDEGSPQYFNIVSQLKEMTTYRHEKTRTQYAVFDEAKGGGLVSYDDPRAICDKVEYANERGMNGFLVWEISGDMIDLGNGQVSTPLIDAVNAKVQNPDMDCSTLRDPEWSMRDSTYRIAPAEPKYVDWSKYDPPQEEEVVDEEGDDEEGGGRRPAPTSNEDSDADSPLNSIVMPKSSGKTSIDEDCPLEFTGYFATKGCTSYAYCQDGAVVGASLPCVPGTLFDVTIGVCTWADTVQCGV